MKPRNNLKDLLQNDTPEKESEPVEDAPVKENKSQRAPSRQGKKLVSGYFDPDAHMQLKLLSGNGETDAGVVDRYTIGVNLRIFTCEGFWKFIFIIHTFRTAGAWFLVVDIFYTPFAPLVLICDL